MLSGTYVDVEMWATCFAVGMNWVCYGMLCLALWPLWVLQQVMGSMFVVVNEGA